MTETNHSVANDSTGVSEQWLAITGKMLVSDQSTPPSANADWRSVNLPESIRGQAPNRSSVWWTFTIPDEPTHTDAEWTIAIPFPDRGNYSVWVNGEFFTTRGRIDQPVGMLRKPVETTLPASLLNQTPDTVQLRVVRGLSTARLAQVIIGPREEVAAASASGQPPQRSIWGGSFLSPVFSSIASSPFTILSSNEPSGFGL